MTRHKAIKPLTRRELPALSEALDHIEEELKNLEKSLAKPYVPNPNAKPASKRELAEIKAKIAEIQARRKRKTP